MGYFYDKKVLSFIKTEFLPANLQEKTITPQNFTPEITPDTGYSALSKVKLKGILVDTHQSYTSQIDSTIAYQKTTPTGALKYASLDKVGGMSYKSVNLFNYEEFTTLGSNYYIEVIGGKTLYRNSEVGNITRWGVYDSNKNLIENMPSTFTASGTYTLPATAKFINPNNDTSTSQMCMGYDISCRSYQPYFEGIRDSAVTSVNDLTIPNEIKALTGYGWGINDTCYNYIDFETKKFVQKVARVDLGSLNYGYISNEDIFRTTISDKSTNNYQLCVPYNTTSNAYNNMPDKSIRGRDTAYSNTNFVFIKDSAYTDATTFKTAMSGVYLYYELATPIEIDISEYIDNNLIDVSGGTTTFNNVYHQAVPSEITYLVGVTE